MTMQSSIQAAQISGPLTDAEGRSVGKFRFAADDPVFAERARLLHNIGRVPGKPGYEHYVLSSNYRMTEFQGALLLSQMRRLPEQTDRKHENGVFLAEGLRQIGGFAPLKADARITKRGYYFFIALYDQKAFSGVPLDRFRAAPGTPPMKTLKYRSYAGAILARGTMAQAAMIAPVSAPPAFHVMCTPLPAARKIRASTTAMKPTAEMTHRNGIAGSI